MTDINSEQPHPFDQLEVAEVVAFVYKKGGEADLRAVFSTFDGTQRAPLTREFLEEIADDLKAVRLRKVACIVLDVAAACPSETDMSLCPYQQTPANAYNIQAWLRSVKRSREWRKERQQRFNSRPNNESILL